jgi:signal transduction histidine kinase
MSGEAARNGAGAKDAGALAVRFGRGIQRSITAFVVALIALPLVSLWATYQIRTMSARVVAIEESRLQLSKALRYSLDEDTGLRGYLETGRTSFLAPSASAHAAVRVMLSDLTSRFEAAGMSAAVPPLEDFTQTHELWHSTVEAPVLANPYRADLLARLAAGKRLMDRMRTDTAQIHSYGMQLVAQTTGNMAEVVLVAIACAAIWVVLVALLTVLAQRRAVAYENGVVAGIVREREENARLSEWRARLLAMLAHDFKSQLAVLIGASHLLEDFPHRRGDPELLASLRNASYALADMADNAILLARAQERKITLYRTAVDVKEILHTVVQRYGGEREFNLRIPPVACIDGDRSYVTRVMDNIIGNAVKYSDKPIDIAVAQTGASICVTVADRGIGIAERDLPHIFEEFWRADRATVKRSGSGVGLFIVKTIMEAHGGEVSVESRYGEGTAVTLKFPASEQQRREFADLCEPGALVQL